MGVEGTAELTRQEVTDLVDSILDGLSQIEAGELPKEVWADEMRDWCLLLLARSDEQRPPSPN